jgi:hypothetical protein
MMGSVPVECIVTHYQNAKTFVAAGSLEPPVVVPAAANADTPHMCTEMKRWLI